MKQLTFKKLSLLGLVLIAASAVTAAMIPSKKDSTSVKKDQNGHLTASTDNDQTCRAGGAANCVNTTGNNLSTSSTRGTERVDDSSNEHPENTTGQDLVED